MREQEAGKSINVYHFGALPPHTFGILPMWRLEGNEAGTAPLTQCDDTVDDGGSDAHGVDSVLNVIEHIFCTS